MITPTSFPRFNHQSRQTVSLEDPVPKQHVHQSKPKSRPETGLKTDFKTEAYILIIVMVMALLLRLLIFNY